MSGALITRRALLPMLICAPAIVRASSLMKVRAYELPFVPSDKWRIIHRHVDLESTFVEFWPVDLDGVARCPPGASYIARGETFSVGSIVEKRVPAILPIENRLDVSLDH